MPEDPSSFVNANNAASFTPLIDPMSIYSTNSAVAPLTDDFCFSPRKTRMPSETFSKGSEILSYPASASESKVLFSEPPASIIPQKNIFPARAESFRTEINFSAEHSHIPRKSIDEIDTMMEEKDAIHMTGEYGDVNAEGGYMKFVPIETALAAEFTWKISDLKDSFDEKIVSLPFGPRDWKWQLMY